MSPGKCSDSLSRLRASCAHLREARERIADPEVRAHIEAALAHQEAASGALVRARGDGAR